MDDDEDDDDYWEEELPPLQYGEASTLDDQMQEEQEHANGFYIQGRSVYLFEEGSLRFQSSDPVLLRHIKALLGHVNDTRHDTVSELLQHAEDELFNGRIPDVRTRELYQHHLNILERRLKDIEEEDTRGA